MKSKLLQSLLIMTLTAVLYRIAVLELSLVSFIGQYKSGKPPAVLTPL